MDRKIWILWLKVASAVTFIVGLVSAAASTRAGSFLWLSLFDILKWPLDGDPSAFQAESYALNAVLGGVMAGWAAFMYLSVSGPIAKGNRELSRSMFLSILIWFFVDSAGSLLAGFPGNVVLNLLFLLVFVPPLMGLIRQG